ncbi:hypothetical protein GCM10028803_26570 [Larkinella knui]|uniref:Nuclear transport factor 2 family protein n=1 Tax=Larkinella knui TaxID=2025310 RepID=A0A3P1CX91_9BACT|nr:hypothetical protein [Larkinella knui]RRB17706.1 hypothetical protein EHT87_05340 [Larkinella knui]
MKIPFLTLVFGLGFAASVVAQQTTSAPATEETKRRLRRTETRTTTTKLYPERDSILVLLKNRMAVLNSDAGASGNLSSWFTEDAKITGADGSAKTPADYQSSRGKTTYRNYRVRKLEINEDTAQSIEEYTELPSDASGSTGAVLKAVSATSKLRKEAGGRWRITEMRITSK